MLSSINTRKYSQGETLFSFFLPFAFLLVQYGYGLGNIMLTYCILFSGYCVIKYQEFPIFRPLSVYTIWYVLILLCTVLFFGHESNLGYWFRWIQIIISGYCVAIIAKHLDRDAMYKSWKIVGMFVCAAVAFQFFQAFVLNQSVLPIRLLPLRAEELMRNENWTTPASRPVAFFTEPAMVVSFLTPVLLFAQQKREMGIAIIVSFAILLSGSTSGVIVLTIMWGMSLFTNRLSMTKKFFFAIFILAVVFVFTNSAIFSGSLEKIYYELSGESSNMDVRTMRGWWVFGALDTRSQLLGITDYDISAYVYGHASDYTWQTGYEENFYLNTVQRILIQTGIIGAVLYVWMLTKLWLSSEKVVRTYLAVVIVSMFFASNFFINGMFVMQFIVLLAYLKRGDKKKVAT